MRRLVYLRRQGTDHGQGQGGVALLIVGVEQRIGRRFQAVAMERRYQAGHGGIVDLHQRRARRCAHLVHDFQRFRLRCRW